MRTLPWPTLGTWLTEREQAALVRFPAPARRSQWLAGRWFGKQLLGQVVGIERLVEIEIISRDERGLGIQPQVLLAGRPWTGSLSISHTEIGVLVALSPDERTSLGVDLACDVPDDARFRSLWFTAEERQWIAHEPAYRTTLLWGLKEAVFKACSSTPEGDGHRWKPRQIEIHPTAEQRFEANFLGSAIGPLDVRVQTVARGLAVAVCLPRQTPARVLLSIPRYIQPTTHPTRLAKQA
jgi:phosphopantetheinyl transferase